MNESIFGLNKAKYPFNKVIIIYDEILADIKPTIEQRKRILKFSDNLMNIILEYAKELNLDVECRLVGSMAKKTSLKSKADIDIFMTFPLEYSEEKLKEYGLLLGEYCIDKAGGKAEKRYASHPYMTGIIEEFEIDFVPCYRISDSSQLKSAVDRTILHTDYIQSHMSDRQADEVLLLKKFMSAINTYGANYKVSGFSGYLCELLILEYDSFENVLKNASEWRLHQEIDLENYGTCKNFKDALIAIDPTDKNRNVAAALTMQKFSEFIVASRNYLKNPSLEYFKDRKVKTDRIELINEFNDRNTTCLMLSFNMPQLPTDVIYPQVNKTCNSLEKISNSHDFKVLKAKYYIDDNNRAHILIEYEVATLSKLKLHYGPLVTDVKNTENFIARHPDCYVKDNKWVVLKNRKYTHSIELLEDMLKEENMHMLKLGKNAKEELLKEYELEYINDYIKDMDESEFMDIYTFLHPNYRLIR